MADKQPGSAPEGRHAQPAVPGEDRAALLLKVLPGALADAVLGRMDADRSARLRERMQAAPAADSPEARQLLRTFVDHVRRVGSPGSEAPKDEFVPSALAKAILGAIDTAPVAPSQALPQGPRPEAATASPEPAAAAGAAPEGDPVEQLRELGAARMAAALRGERTATVVVALSSLPTADVGEVLKRLPPERRREATLRLVKGAPGDADLRRAVARAVVAKGRALGDDLAALEEDAEVRKLAGLLRGLEREDRKEVLESLSRDDPATAEKVKNLLYVFEDLLRFEDRSVQALLAEVEIKTLALALNGADAALAAKVMNNLSQRARDTLTEEIDLLGKPRAPQVLEARGAVVAAVQRLDGEGKLVMLE